MANTSLLERYAALGDRPTDTDEEKLQHRFLIATGSAMSCGGLFWGVLCLAFGMPEPSVIPFGYAILTAINFTVLGATKRFGLTRTFQVLMSLLLPFLLQWWLGGFMGSGAVMLWAMLAFVASLSFSDPRSSVFWIVLYLVLTVVSGWLDAGLTVPAPLRAEGVSTFLFTVNLSLVSAMVFVLTLGFWRLRNTALAQLNEKNLELEQKNLEVAASQQALVQSEKLAALGHLVAGVAHELNTPLGAIRASVGNLDVAVAEIMTDLPKVLASATKEELEALTALLAEGASPQPPRSSKEERTIRRALAKELTAAGIEGAIHLADKLVQIGVDELAESSARTLVASARAPELVRGAYNLAGLRRNRATIDLAAERASKIVFALKRYAHPGAEGETSKASLAENLETVLTLYHSQLKHGVEVVRDFDNDVVVEAHHDELNQVWTNLVHNALQAMEHQGRLEVSVGADDDGAIVTVVDDGKGIPEEKLARIFEPFFTTKAAGEGSGLGLSISRDIVARHGGTIEVDSRPGRTAFRVRISKGQPR